MTTNCQKLRFWQIIYILLLLNISSSDHGGKKDLLAYYMVFNMTLAPNNLFTKLDDVIKKDLNLISLKLSIDNAFLEQKAVATGLGYIPEITQSV